MYMILLEERHIQSRSAVVWCGRVDEKMIDIKQNEEEMRGK